MNVSIATVAEDLNTTITGIQSAIVLYTLAKGKLREKRAALERALSGRMGPHQRCRDAGRPRLHMEIGEPICDPTFTGEAHRKHLSAIEYAIGARVPTHASAKILVAVPGRYAFCGPRGHAVDHPGRTPDVSGGPHTPATVRNSSGVTRSRSLARLLAGAAHSTAHGRK